MQNTTILSFDIEEHHRIEAASDLDCSNSSKADYGTRAESTTRILGEILAEAECKATFFVLGEFASQFPEVIRDLHDAGHEIASHGWDHRPVYRMSRREFREDITKSKDALEQVIGAPIYGYRAPTFSVMKQTAWAIDELTNCGYTYDSSVFPIHHDRYGVPDAPATPFRCFGENKRCGLLELPPLTIRGLFTNIPIGGGGYFRLLPLSMVKAGIWMNRKRPHAVSMLYFHPWEFDPEQPKLPLSRFRSWRTYVGIKRTVTRLKRLLQSSTLTTFRRAVDIAEALEGEELVDYHLDGRQSEQFRSPSWAMDDRGGVLIAN